MGGEGGEGGEEGEGGEAWHEHVGGAKRNADGDGTAPAKEAAAARAQAAEAQGAEATVAPAAEDVPVTVPEEGKEEEGTPETDADAPAAVASDAVEQAAPAGVEPHQPIQELSRYLGTRKRRLPRLLHRL